MSRNKGERRPDAKPVTEIRHENTSATILSEIDNLVDRRREYDSTTGRA